MIFDRRRSVVNQEHCPTAHEPELGPGTGKDRLLVLPDCTTGFDLGSVCRPLERGIDQLSTRSSGRLLLRPCSTEQTGVCSTCRNSSQNARMAAGESVSFTAFLARSSATAALCLTSADCGSETSHSRNFCRARRCASSARASEFERETRICCSAIKPSAREGEAAIGWRHRCAGIRGADHHHPRHPARVDKGDGRYPDLRVVALSEPSRAHANPVVFLSGRSPPTVAGAVEALCMAVAGIHRVDECEWHDPARTPFPFHSATCVAGNHPP